MRDIRPPMPAEPAGHCRLDPRVAAGAALLLCMPTGALLFVTAAIVAVMHLGTVHASASSPTSQALAIGYMPENERAMDKMMAAMAIRPTGNVDRDFVAMMVPHHQGAIDMALAELRHGKDETLRRMAQEIIVEQQQEIVAMHLAANKLAAPPIISPMPLDVCTDPSPNQHMRVSHVPGVL
jgi:hypothetical protein